MRIDGFEYRLRRKAGGAGLNSAEVSGIVDTIVNTISGGVDTTFQALWDHIAANSTDIADIPRSVTTTEGDVRFEITSD